MGHVFKDKSLLKRALTHASADTVRSNERLEFLGDRVLGLVVADKLHQLYPDYPEALVERGTMKFETGDVAGARADWQAAIRAAPNGDAANAARERLATLVAPPTPAKPQK